MEIFIVASRQRGDGCRTSAGAPPRRADTELARVDLAVA
jgi:hypothetical protein